jgi:hypothetical protein
MLQTQILIPTQHNSPKNKEQIYNYKHAMLILNLVKLILNLVNVVKNKVNIIFFYKKNEIGEIKT